MSTYEQIADESNRISKWFTSIIPQARPRFNRTLRSHQVEVLPGVNSSDHRWPGYLRTLYADVVDTLPSSSKLDSSLIVGSSPDDYSACLHIAGHVPSHVGYPQVNVPRASDWFDHTDRIAFENLVTIMTEDWNPTLGYDIQPSFAGLSSPTSGSKDPRWKWDRVLDISSYGIESYLDTMAHSPARALAKYHDSRAVANLSRLQPDRFIFQDGRWRSKPRFILDDKGLITGDLIEQDKSIDPEFFDGHISEADIDGVAAMRYRLVNAPTFRTTILGSVWMQGFRSIYFERYGATWHHKGREDILKKTEGYIPIAVDIGSMDTKIPEFMFTAFEEVMHRTWNVLPHLIGMWTRCAIFSPDPCRDRKPAQGIWFGSPADHNDMVYAGLLSGVFTNTDMGKMFGTFLVLRLIRLAIGLDLTTNPSHLRAFLQHKTPDIRLLNLGDDSLLCISPRRRDWADKIRAYLANDKFADSRDHYASLDVEDPTAFLSFLIAVDPLDGRVCEVLPNSMSYLRNFLVPEYGMRTQQRPYPYLGYQARENVYRDAPAYSQLRELRNKHAYDILGVDIEAVMASGVESDQARLDAQLNLDDYAIARWLEDPSRKYWDPNLMDQDLPGPHMKVSGNAIHSLIAHFKRN